MNTTREEHLAWCKKRAMEYLDRGDYENAFASMIAELQNHPGTKYHPAIQWGAVVVLNGGMNTVAEMRVFINGVN